MFNKPRRPMPSKAALRVLYQLAYISSGTAAGLAALCAEERRRRTNYVQKIADNAKRIRGHPRYVGSASAVVVATEHEEKEWVTDATRGENFEWAARGETLPSKVEDGYRQLVEKEWKRARRSWSSAVQGGSNSKTLPKSTIRKTGNGNTAERNLSHEEIQPRDNSKQLAMPLPLYNVRNSSDLDFQSYKRSTGFDALKPDVTAHELDQPVALRNAPNFLMANLANVAKSSSIQFSQTLDGQLELPATVAHDTDEFFRVQPWCEKSGVMRDVARRIYQEALSLGMFSEVRALFMWRFQHDTEANFQANVQGVCEACHLFAEKTDPTQLHNFYSTIVHSTRFNRLPLDFRLSTTFTIAAEMRFWGLETRLRDELLASVVRSADQATRNKVLMQTCDTLLSRGQPVLAMILVRAVLYLCRHNIGTEKLELSREFYDPIFRSAIEKRHLACCCQILRDQSLLTGNTEQLSVWYQKRLEEIAVACTQSKQYKVLSAMIPTKTESNSGKRRLRWLLSRLRSCNDDTVVAFGIASVWNEQATGQIMDQFYELVPAHLRSTVEDARAVTRLREVWSMTHNFEAAWDEYVSAKAFNNRVGNQNALFRSTITMVEICNSANRPDSALELLTQLGRDRPHNDSTLSLAVVALGKKGAWNQVNNLIGIAQRENQNLSHRSVNIVLRTHSQQHSLSETMDLVKKVVDRLGFRPSDQTTSIMLKSCALSKTPAQASRIFQDWLQYLRTVDVKGRLTAKMISNLLTSFYLRHRPSHTFIMWLCQRLLKQRPSLKASDFSELMREAIGYDLRMTKPRSKEEATANLHSLTNAKQEIPKPTHLVGWRATVTRSKSPESTSPASVGIRRPDSRSEHPWEVNSDKYNTVLEDDLIPDAIVSRGKSRRLEREMVLALSQGRYRDVLMLYHQSTDVRGRAVSRNTLGIAVDASVRLHRGDSANAEAMIARAQSAGMDVTGALEPLILHRLRRLSPAERRDMSNLHAAVMDYYQLCRENSWYIKHFVGTTAANMMINNRMAQQGLNLLHTMRDSRWEELGLPFDIVQMTVYLKGYAAIGSLDGVLWAVKTVLEKDMRISSTFTNTLKLILPKFRTMSRYHITRSDGSILNLSSRAARFRIQHWRRLCIKRREQQWLRARQIGIRLVDEIIRQARELELPTD